jgi:aspartyl-tRNA(Asn)/glutamyl-tRNA(Gln) amidotransferase subunit B
LEAGKTIVQETRSFDAANGTTFSMRSKEMAHDYRYFPEPDLPPVIVTEEYIASVKKMMPALPRELFKKYTGKIGLSEYDAGVLTESKEIANYFDELITQTSNYKAAANWVMGPVKSWLNENAAEIINFPLKPGQLVQLIQMVEEGKVSHSAAAQKIFPELISNPASNPSDIAVKLNLSQESNSDLLRQYVEQAIARHPEKVAEYKSGKTGLVGLFMGEVMKLSGGKADPKTASKLVKEILDNK